MNEKLLWKYKNKYLDINLIVINTVTPSSLNTFSQSLANIIYILMYWFKLAVFKHLTNIFYHKKGWFWRLHLRHNNYKREIKHNIQKKQGQQNRRSSAKTYLKSRKHNIFLNSDLLTFLYLNYTIALLLRFNLSVPEILIQRLKWIKTSLQC